MRKDNAINDDVMDRLDDALPGMVKTVGGMQVKLLNYGVMSHKIAEYEACSTHYRRVEDWPYWCVRPKERDINVMRFPAKPGAVLTSREHAEQIAEVFSTGEWLSTTR